VQSLQEHHRQVRQHHLNDNDNVNDDGIVTPSWSWGHHHYQNDIDNTNNEAVNDDDMNGIVSQQTGEVILGDMKVAFATRSFHHRNIHVRVMHTTWTDNHDNNDDNTNNNNNDENNIDDDHHHEHHGHGHGHDHHNHERRHNNDEDNNNEDEEPEPVMDNDHNDHEPRVILPLIYYHIMMQQS
jgi:hypothetical protein